MDILEVIKKDHESIREGIADIGSELTSPEGKVLFFRDLARLVESHSKAEEATLLDFARNDLESRPLALASLEEHALTDELGNKIRHTEDPESWEAKVKVYCDLLAHHLDEAEKELYPKIDSRLEAEERVEMAKRYEKLRGLSLGVEHAEQRLAPEMGLLAPLYDETGRIGYLVAWLLGIPAWVLFVIFLIRGH